MKKVAVFILSLALIQFLPACNMVGSAEQTSSDNTSLVDNCEWMPQIIGDWTLVDTPDPSWDIMFQEGGDGFIFTSNMRFECDTSTGELIMTIDGNRSKYIVEFTGDDSLTLVGDNTTSPLLLERVQ